MRPSLTRGAGSVPCLLHCSQSVHEASSTCFGMAAVHPALPLVPSRPATTYLMPRPRTAPRLGNATMTASESGE